MLPAGCEDRRPPMWWWSSGAAPDEDQARRGGIERRALKVAERLFDGKARRIEHRRDLVEIVSANALQISLLTDRDAFVERTVTWIEPPLDLDGPPRRLQRLALHELLELPIDVEVVEEEDAADAKHACHLAHDLLVLI